MTENKGQRAVVVLGMHRSGTSAITRGLKALGVELGERMMIPLPDQNAKGFWEDSDIYELDEKILAALGRTWHSLSLIEPAEWQKPALKNLEKQALELVGSRVARYPLWGFKDPRTARLLPFWQPVFRQLGIAESYVIGLRNPLSVAKSLAALNGFTAEKSYLLWLEHLLPALSETAGKPRVVVDFDAVMARPVEELHRIAQRLDLPSHDAATQAIAEYADDFLAQELRHSVFGLEDLKQDNRVCELMRKAYELLHDLAHDRHGPMGSPALDTEWERLERNFRALAPVYRYLDDCERRIEELSRANTALEAALPDAEKKLEEALAGDHGPE